MLLNCVDKSIDVKTNRSDNRINLTLGALIATVSGFALEYAADTREADDLARLVLIELLQGLPLEAKSSTGTFPELCCCIDRCQGAV